MEVEDLPEGIGPHEGRECEMMAAGRKPLERFSEILESSAYFPVEEFAPYVRSGAIVERERTYLSPNGHSVRCLYYVLPGEEWRIDAANAIDADIISGRRPATEDDDIQMGRLLGYSEQEIGAFLAHARQGRASLRLLL